MSNQERLRQLLRRRAGQEKRDQLAQLLGTCATGEWTIVPPPESDPAVATVFEAVRVAREGGRLQVEADLSEADFQQAVGRVLEGVADGSPVIMTISAVSEVGHVESTVELPRSCALAILDHDQDSLIIADPRASWGMVCQRFDETARVTYQLESWQGAN